MSGDPVVCRVFVIGEGPSDIGWLASAPQWRPRRRGRRVPADEGFIPPVLRKIGREAGFELELDGRKLTSLPRTSRRDRTGGNALTRQARQALALARAADAQVLVFVHDVDREQARARSDQERRQQMSSVDEDIAAGLEGADPVTLIGTPCRMIEAWALGDPEAIAQLAEDDAEPVPARPEELWGDKHDRESEYPKHVLTRCIGRDCGREDFARLAEAADLDTVAARCPESFAPFLARARAIAADCAGRRDR